MGALCTFSSRLSEGGISYSADYAQEILKIFWVHVKFGTLYEIELAIKVPLVAFWTAKKTSSNANTYSLHWWVRQWRVQRAKRDCQSKKPKNYAMLWIVTTQHSTSLTWQISHKSIQIFMCVVKKWSQFSPTLCSLTFPRSKRDGQSQAGYDILGLDVESCLK